MLSAIFAAPPPTGTMLSAILAAPPPTGKTVTLNNGVIMPSMNLGTCCGSEPKVGLQPWLDAGGVGIDYHDQTDIAQIIKSVPRSSIFLTTKVPAGFGNKTDCAADPNVALNYVRENLKELGVDQVDLALVHRPCQRSQTSDPAAANNALWKGMQQALALNLTRAIGVSNYKKADLEALDMGGAVPSVNQCQMSVTHHDDESIAYCQSKGIVFESYFTMKGCPWNNADVKTIAANHNVSISQVCLRYVLDRGGAIAAGTGADPAKVGPYAAENLDIYGFALTADEMDTLSKIPPIVEA
jgi:diketogulonate reductase-like aldo/keto reductase